jgi:hypothetical protein
VLSALLEVARSAGCIIQEIPVEVSAHTAQSVHEVCRNTVAA